MQKSSLRLWALAVGLTLLASPLWAQQATRSPADRELEMRVRGVIADRDIPGVSVSARDGAVTLSGTVPSLYTRKDAVERARKVSGVREIVDSLAVTRVENDQQLAQNVANRLMNYVQYTVFDNVDIHTKDGVVTLLGDVTMPFKAKELAELATRVTGVQEVRNQIEALPVSQVDDEIRYVLANRLYGDPMFSNYNIQVNPPIHIVVKGGQVTLTGWVLSEIERTKAGFIARAVFGVMGVDNRIQVESRR